MYELDYSLALGPGLAGLADLTAQLVDSDGLDVGAAVTSGFVEVGTGNYLWHYAAFPDGHRGGVKFYRAATPGDVLLFGAINPEEIGGDAITVEAIWTYAPRTLTQSAAEVAAAVSGSDLLIIGAVTFVATLTGLTFPAGWSRIFWTVKSNAGVADSQSIVQVVVSNPGDAADGLLVLERAPAPDATQGVLVVAGDALTITLHDNATTVPMQGNYIYDVKALLPDSTSVLLTAGAATVTYTPTETID